MGIGVTDTAKRPQIFTHVDAASPSEATRKDVCGVCLRLLVTKFTPARLGKMLQESVVVDLHVNCIALYTSIDLSYEHDVLQLSFDGFVGEPFDLPGNFGTAK